MANEVLSQPYFEFTKSNDDTSTEEITPPTGHQFQYHTIINLFQQKLYQAKTEYKIGKL